MRALIAGLVAALVLAVAALVVAAVVVRSAEAPSKADCMYAAAAAYPDWKPGQARVTETTPECDGLSEADKQEIRTVWDDATWAAIRNAQKA